MMGTSHKRGMGTREGFEAEDANGWRVARLTCLPFILHA